MGLTLFLADTRLRQIPKGSGKQVKFHAFFMPKYNRLKKELSLNLIIIMSKKKIDKCLI